MIMHGDRVRVELKGVLNTINGTLIAGTELTGIFADETPDGIVHLDNTGGCFISLYRNRGKLYVLDTEVELSLSKI